MSWRDGDDILCKGFTILGETFPKKTEQAIYLSGLIQTLCDSDFDYIQFRDSRTPYDDLLDYVEKRDSVYEKAFAKLAKTMDGNIDRRALSHYLTATHRKIQLDELKRLKSSSVARKQVFQTMWEMSSEHIDDEEHLHYYTQALANGFLLTTDDVDDLVESEKRLAPIVKMMRKEEEGAQVRIQKLLKKASNVQELNEKLKKLEVSVKRSLTALSTSLKES